MLRYDFQESAAFDSLSVHFELEGNFASVLQVDVFAAPLTETQISKVQLLITDFARYQGRISLQLDFIIGSAFHVADSSGPVKNTSLSVVHELNFFDLLWLENSRKGQDIKNFVDGY